MKPIILSAALLITGCAHFPRQTHSMEEVQIKGIDTQASIAVSEKKLAQHKLGSGLGFWAMRDQKIDVQDAQKISDAYFRHIEYLKHPFDIWHYTWSISNFYRSGSPEVQVLLKSAWEDGTRRGLALDKKYVTKHLTDSLIYRGWYHGGGWLAAKRHLVVPGDDRFLQSESEFRDR